MLDADVLDPLFCEFAKIGIAGPTGPARADDADPHAFFAALRRRGPVQPLPIPNEPGVLALSFEAVSRVFREPERFSSRGYAAVVGPIFGHSILQMDPPEHTRYRGLVQQAFSRRALERWRERLLVPYAHALVDRFVARGHADLMRELAFPLPLEMISGMLGVPDADRARYMGWAVEILSGSLEAGVARGAAHALGEYFTPRIEAARGRGGDDLVALLANVELAGARLSVDEILPFLRLLSPAAFETTARALSNLLCGLLNAPEQLAAVAAEPRRIAAAVHEGLRWEPPLVGFARTATRDTELCGSPLPAGATVALIVASANRDESRWEDPDRFDVFRPMKPHLAFAQGPHTCLGMHLALLELETALAVALERLPGLRLAAGASPARVSGGAFRTALRLPVEFTPGVPRSAPTA